MVQLVLIGIGAGLAAALLFASPIGGTSLAFPLFCVTGVPIAIAGFGWTPLAAAIAALVRRGGALPLHVAARRRRVPAPLRLADRLVRPPRRPVADERRRRHRVVSPMAGFSSMRPAPSRPASRLSASLIGYNAESLAPGMTDALQAMVRGPARSSGAAEPGGNRALRPVQSPAPALHARRHRTGHHRPRPLARRAGRAEIRPARAARRAGLDRRAAARGGACLRRRARAELPAGALGRHRRRLRRRARPARWRSSGSPSFTPSPSATIRGGSCSSASISCSSSSGFPILLFAALGLAETLLHLRARRFRGSPPTT